MAPAAERSASPGDAPTGAPNAESLAGTVAETMDAGGYTYARLVTPEGDAWVAVTEQPLAPGDRLRVAVDVTMRGFRSKTLDREFATLHFASRVARAGESLDEATPSPTPRLLDSHRAPSGGVTPAIAPNAPPAGGFAIAEVWARRAALAGQPVTVRGTVVKVTSGVLDRTWVHLRDGSGSERLGTHDLTVTTVDRVAAGEVVTMRGTLATGKDVGAGYAYEALLEDAAVQR